MIILAIDTSCDDTCISVIKIPNPKTRIPNLRIEILSNIVSPQINIHQKYGGVYPSLAKREHQKNLPLVLKQALRETNIGDRNIGDSPRTVPILSVPILSPIKTGKYHARARHLIDAVAVTVGPGLEPCLWTGINFAKILAKKWNKPIIPVNHIEAHLLAFLLSQKSEDFQFKFFNFQKMFPAIVLIVSGGHTQLILTEKIGKYKIIGETRDDAAGECFDKTARILGLPYPGGPAIAAEAAMAGKFRNFDMSKHQNINISKYQTYGNRIAVSLPRPMLYSKNYDFSFSGLKTAVLYDWKKRPENEKKSHKYVKMMASEIQQSIIDVLLKKTIKAAKDYGAKTVILGGGVAANEELRKQFRLKIEKNLPNSLFIIPNSNFCTDNAAMVALAGWFNRKKATKNLEKIRAEANLRI